MPFVPRAGGSASNQPTTPAQVGAVDVSEPAAVGEMGIALIVNRQKKGWIGILLICIQLLSVRISWDPKTG
jgi:hypothetical protein